MTEPLEKDPKRKEETDNKNANIHVYSGVDMKLKEAEKTIANKDVIIRMLQQQVKKLEEAYKQNLKLTEDFRFKYFMVSERLRRYGECCPKIKEKLEKEKQYREQQSHWNEQPDQVPSPYRKCLETCPHIQHLKNLENLMLTQYKLLEQMILELANKNVEQRSSDVEKNTEEDPKPQIPEEKDPKKEDDKDSILSSSVESVEGGNPVMKSDSVLLAFKKSNTELHDKLNALLENNENRGSPNIDSSTSSTPRRVSFVAQCLPSSEEILNGKVDDEEEEDDDDERNEESPQSETESSEKSVSDEKYEEEQSDESKDTSSSASEQKETEVTKLNTNTMLIKEIRLLREEVSALKGSSKNMTDYIATLTNIVKDQKEILLAHFHNQQEVTSDVARMNSVIYEEIKLVKTAVVDRVPKSPQRSPEVSGEESSAVTVEEYEVMNARLPTAPTAADASPDSSCNVLFNDKCARNSNGRREKNVTQHESENKNMKEEGKVEDDPLEKNVREDVQGHGERKSSLKKQGNGENQQITCLNSCQKNCKMETTPQKPHICQNDAKTGTDQASMNEMKDENYKLRSSISSVMCHLNRKMNELKLNKKFCESCCTTHKFMPENCRNNVGSSALTPPESPTKPSTTEVIEDIKSLEMEYACMKGQCMAKDQKLNCLNSLIGSYQKTCENVLTISTQKLPHLTEESECRFPEFQTSMKEIQSENFRLKSTISSVICHLNHKLRELKELNQCYAEDSSVDSNSCGDQEPEVEIEDIYNAVRSTFESCSRVKSSSSSCLCKRLSGKVSKKLDALMKSQTGSNSNTFICECGHKCDGIVKTGREKKTPSEILMANLEYYVGILNERLGMEKRIRDPSPCCN